MRTPRIAPLLLAALLCPLGLARATTPAGAANPAWEKVKSLEGNWSGTYDDGSSARLSYRVVSSGTAVMETMTTHDSHEMITVYHPDGTALRMTHYCSEANQSRMRAAGLSPDGKSLTFEFVDVTNAGPDSHVMSGLKLTFVDADHLVAEWTSRQKGAEHTGVFKFARVK